MRKIKAYKLFEEAGKHQTLRDLVGDIKSINKIGYRTITETTKGCFTNLDIKNALDKECHIEMYRNIESPTGRDCVGDISCPGEFRGYICFIDGEPKIISYGPGDERGCVLFGDVFVASGHDGSFLWNVKTGEFKDHCC